MLVRYGVMAWGETVRKMVCVGVGDDVGERVRSGCVVVARKHEVVHDNLPSISGRIGGPGRRGGLGTK